MTQSSDRTSQGLEVISKGQLGPLQEKRSLLRLNLATEQFRLLKSGKVFGVADLSEKGMGLWLVEPKDLQFFSVGLSIEGVLNLRGERFSISGRIKHISTTLVGCEFENLEPQTHLGIAKFLDPKVLGAELKPIPSSEAHTLWYHGPTGTDLILKRAVDGSYQRWDLYILGNVVQWEKDKGVFTGKVAPSVSPGEIRGILRLESYIVNQDVTLDPEKLNIAKTVILSSNLPQDLKTWFVRQLER